MNSSCTHYQADLSYYISDIECCIWEKYFYLIYLYGKSSEVPMPCPASAIILGV